MIVIGIDPGKKGGVCVLSKTPGRTNDGKFCMHNEGEAVIMPCLKGLVDYFVHEHVMRHYSGGIAYVENVHAMPGQGVTSMFNFGKGFGEILGVLAALNIRTELVSPQKWKRAVLAGTDRDKAAAIRFVQENYPDIDLTPGRCRVPQDGIADAVCIAHYGMLQEMKK